MKNIQELRVGKTTDVLLDSNHDREFNESDHYSIIEKPRHEKLIGKSLNFRRKFSDPSVLLEISKQIEEFNKNYSEKKKYRRYVF